MSCYAFLRWWLPLSQHPGCLSLPASLLTLSAHFGALTGGLGCFPLERGTYLPRSDSRESGARHSEFVGRGQRSPAPPAYGRSTSASLSRG